MKKFLSVFLLLVFVATLGFAAGAKETPVVEETCSNRGLLDTLYCDEDFDLVADLPKDKSKWRKP